MFEDVRDARVVGGIGLESDRKDIVAVVAGDVEMFGASLVVLQVQCRQLEFGDMLRSYECKAVKLVTRFWKLRKVCHGFPSSAFGSVAQHLGYAEPKRQDEDIGMEMF